MIETRIGYTAHPSQLEFHDSQARFKSAIAGRRGGKTVSGAYDFLARIYAQDLPKVMAVPYNRGSARKGTSEWWRRPPRAHYWVVAEVYDLLDEAKRQLLRALPAELLEHTNTGDYQWWLKPDIFVEFKTGKDPKRLVSPGLNGAWIEEASRLHRTAWAEFLRPTLSDKYAMGLGGWCNVTGTPLGEDWVYDDFVTPALNGNEQYSFHTWTTAQNTAVPGLAEEVENARRTLPPEFFEREYEASFRAFTGQIYRYWREDHAIDKLPPGIQFTRILGGCDWGWSNPGALVVVGLTESGNVYVFDEVYDRSELVEDFWVPEAKELQVAHRFNEWVADPAEPDNLNRFSRAGIRVTGHRNYGSGRFDEHMRSVRAGIRTVAALIYQKKLWIVKSKCPNTLKELRTYQWEKTPGGRQLDRPALGQSDHAITAMRYAISYATKPSGVMRPL